MGKFAKMAKAAEKKIKKAGATAELWWLDHQDQVWSAIDTGCQLTLAWFAGVGIGTVICDVTGINDAVRKADIAKAEMHGYERGFNDGGGFTARMIGVAQNGGKTPEPMPSSTTSPMTK